MKRKYCREEKLTGEKGSQERKAHAGEKLVSGKRSSRWREFDRRERRRKLTSGANSGSFSLIALLQTSAGQSQQPSDVLLQISSKGEAAT